MMRHVAANGLTLLILALVVLFGLVGWGQSRYSAPGPLSAPLVFEVPRGAGLASVSRELAEVGQVLALNAPQRWLKLILPSATPQIFTGLTLALIYSWLATIGKVASC